MVAKQTIIMTITIMTIIITITMEEDGEELGSNAEQVVGRGFLDGSTHCGASLSFSSSSSSSTLWSCLPAWTLASTHCGPLPSPPASHCASQPLISQSIFLLPQSLPQTYLPDLLEDPLWHVQPACFSQLLASTYSPIYLPSSILHVPVGRPVYQSHHRKCHHRCHRHCHDHVHDQLK